MKTLLFALALLISNITIGQKIFSENGRSISFSNDPHYSYLKDWSYSRNAYYTIQNDTLYVGEEKNDDTYGISSQLQFVNIYDFDLKSVIPKRDNKTINLLPIDNDYHKIVLLEFDSEQLLNDFYIELKNAYNSESRQKIANYESGLVVEEDHNVENALYQQIKSETQTKNVYEEYYYDFDLAAHGIENQFVILKNEKGEECMKVNRLNHEFFRKVNGNWISKAILIKQYMNLDDYEGIRRTYGKQDTLAVWSLEKDGYNIVQYTEDGGDNKYRYYPTTDIIKSFDELTGTSTSYNYQYDPEKEQVIYFDTKTVFFTVSGGKPSMSELLIMLYLYKSPLFK